MNSRLQTLFELAPPGPLNGTLVVEIGGYISGPVAGEELARKGALVIKLEKDLGDPSRVILPPAAFASFNAAKASFAATENIDYQNLLALADVIIDNRSPTAKERDAVLQTFLKKTAKAQPVIYCSITGYDSDENRYRKAFDVLVQADTGMPFSNAFSPLEPLKVGFYLLDIATGLQAASCVKDCMLGLARKRITPQEGVVRVEISMAKMSALFQTVQYLSCYTTGKEVIRTGNDDLNICPFSFYRAKDGLLAIGIIDDKQFKLFCEKILKNPALATAYPTNAARLLNKDNIRSAIEGILKTADCAAWIAACQKLDLTCTKVNSVTEALEIFGKMVIDFTKDKTPIIANPSVLLSQAPPEEKLADAPKLQQHQNDVMSLITRCHASTATFSDLYNAVMLDAVSRFKLFHHPSSEPHLTGDHQANKILSYRASL